MKTTSGQVRHAQKLKAQTPPSCPIRQVGQGWQEVASGSVKELHTFTETGVISFLETLNLFPILERSVNAPKYRPPITTAGYTGYIVIHFPTYPGRDGVLRAGTAPLKREHQPSAKAAASAASSSLSAVGTSAARRSQRRRVTHSSSPASTPASTRNSSPVRVR